MFRKVAPWYARRFGPAVEFNRRVVQLSSRAEFEKILSEYRAWRQPFLDDSGELKARFRPAPLASSFMGPEGASPERRIPVPKGAVETW
jgi:hypothetical protein